MAEGRSEGCQATVVYADNDYDTPGSETSSLYHCDVCGKNYETSYTLSQHSLNHTADRLHECPECGKGFKQPSHLHQHMRIHTNERPFPCYLCEKSFKQSCQLKQHLRVHTGDKPYKCSHCDRSFKQRSQVQQHTRLHTGEKPYQCDICERKFTQASQLKSHKNTHERHARKLNPNLPVFDPTPARPSLNAYRRPGRPRKDDIEPPPMSKPPSLIPTQDPVPPEHFTSSRPQAEPEPTNSRYSISSDDETVSGEYDDKQTFCEHSPVRESVRSDRKYSSIEPKESYKLNYSSQRKTSSTETSPLLKIPNLWFPSTSPHRSPSPTNPQGHLTPSEKIFEVVGAQRKYLGI